MASEPGCKVFIGNINENVRKSELRHEFEKFGEVMDVYISNGYAFVTFAQSDSASSAIRDMDGSMYMGEKLRVEISRGRANSDRRGGMGGSRGSDMGRRGGEGGGGRRDRPPPLGGSFAPYPARRDDFRDARSGMSRGGDKGGRGGFGGDRGYAGRDGASRYDRRDGPPSGYHRSSRVDSGRDFERRRSFSPPLPPRSYSDEVGGFGGSRSRAPPYGGSNHRGPMSPPRRGGHFDDRRRLSPPPARFEREGGGFPRRSPLPAPHSRRDEMSRRPMTPPIIPASRFRSRSPVDRHLGPSRAEYSDRRGPDLRDSRPSFGRGGRGGRPRPDNDYDRGPRGGGDFGGLSGGRGRGGGRPFRDDRGPPPPRSGGGLDGRHRSPRPRY
ncbi:hypothetical protein TCAL_05586 [Tigriopus californicus]|uniref:RRM domain-containing protein n=1 Tax=Tigriopus californicus TaxID=6832 RepID=A0A553NC04_TIGCA|nr:serine/arginine-rich splicing factor 1-like [Tigriopus californicus]TRY62971.1 hypothetical protein TCAL_05586 [Tigriopus californicus]|eukprot:TCALIF_05586-PA protein Name:"Similar to Rsf1 RNA-binding protein Rsf1 (Drosophila melanogaster)" AED:0.00 eAED:0.00 QI:251/1/1/1/0/0/2/836/382